METTVEKLEAMFQKSEADLDYIEKRLKLDFANNAAENGSAPEENPVVLLENLMAIKARYTALCSEVKEIAAAQKESVDSIRQNLNSVMQLIQQVQQTADVEVPPLSELEQQAAELLGAAGSPSTAEVAPPTAASSQQPPPSCATGDFEDLSEAMLEAVPVSIRGDVTLADLNTFYRQLQQHFSTTKSGSLSVQKMKQLNMSVSEAKLKTLQHLALLTLDRKGCVHLPTPGPC
ncbi:TIP41-like protein isoform X3 [Myripristis murdjan]|uniref:Protein FAM33A n=1 Tax=Myripristis murdjan TaxID=586833 RepID=A0A667XR64_9TELE|nr:TIP41-like protein isoform X3 [Myripristis murdjan]